MVDLNTAFCQYLLYVSVTQLVRDVVAHRHEDDRFRVLLAGEIESNADLESDEKQVQYGPSRQVTLPEISRLYPD